ncbi:MAG: hypothetical protein K0Q72_2719 [Armatimonadetes bacterium]|jgi:hypothetical protein|nr:hypothetical protein [Armatimonadota bacterium]
MEPTNPAAPIGQEQPLLLTYSVLAGLTPLIPVPFVDDVVRDYFRKQLVRSLAGMRGVTLSREAVLALTAEPGGCLVSGCLAQVFLFPFKLIFRKLFFFLEWKRSLDLTSHTYHYGYLVDCALREGYLGPHSPRSVAEVRAAIDDVCRTAPVKPVESAVAGAFRQSRSLLNTTVRTFTDTLRHITGRRDAARVEAALVGVEAQERQQVAGVVELLQERLRAVPDGHFRSLCEQLRARLG